MKTVLYKQSVSVSSTISFPYPGNLRSDRDLGVIMSFLFYHYGCLSSDLLNQYSLLKSIYYFFVEGNCHMIQSFCRFPFVINISVWVCIYIAHMFENIFRCVCTHEHQYTYISTYTDTQRNKYQDTRFLSNVVDMLA